MSASDLNLLNLDFDNLKSSFKNYLKGQDRFKDYDFDGSNMAVLLDLLAYNTYLNSFYTNMVASEMFLDTAQLRDSIVSHAKELNYLPRSFRSSEAVIDITVDTANTSVSSLFVPKGTTFSTKVGSNAYSFSTDRNIVMSGVSGVFTANTVSIFEGPYTTETYVINYDNDNQRFTLSNPNIDISSLTVTVIEDNGASIAPYLYTTSLFNLDSNSKVFFVQPGLGDKYEIFFGDGVVGRKPKNGATIVCEYRTCSGELPNGAFKFSIDGSIEGYTNINISTRTKATGGAVGESTESIRFNAPRHFSTQERAITSSDYETLLKTNFPEIQAVSAYGGETITPPQFGKVFISVDIKDVDGIPSSKRNEYISFITNRCPVSIEPEVIDPDDLNILIESIVRYDNTITDLAPNDITTLVISNISNYSKTNLSDFKKTLRFSRLVNTIDSSHPSIVSNETKIKAIRKIQPLLNTSTTISLSFDQPLALISSSSDSTIITSPFLYNSILCVMVDDGQGNLKIVGKNDIQRTSILDIGTVDYNTGILKIVGLRTSSYIGTAIKIYAKIKTDDIFSSKNSIISIDEADLRITSIVSSVPQALTSFNNSSSVL